MAADARRRARERRDACLVEPLKPAEAAKLFAAAAEDRLSPLWLLVTALGLRRGEALALRWEDIDLDRGHLQIRATLQRVDGALGRSEMPKTKSSRRALPLPEVVVEALRAHRAAQVQERSGCEAGEVAEHVPEERGGRGQLGVQPAHRNAGQDERADGHVAAGEHQPAFAGQP